jgi:hypothetical protein
MSCAGDEQRLMASDAHAVRAVVSRRVIGSGRRFIFGNLLWKGDSL